MPGRRDAVTSPWEYAARLFEPRPRRHASPGELARALDRRTGTSPALELIDRELVSLINDSGDDALAIFMPSQEGKSEKVSRRFPEWLLDHDPSLRIAIISYELDLAVRWGRAIKQDIAAHPCPNGGECDDLACPSLHITVRRDSHAAGRWDTPEGGGVYCVGIFGPLVGKPVDVLLLDDPVKDRAAAESQKVRDATWDWWESVALMRLAPGGKVVLIMTRWSLDDLAGRIFSRPSPLRWRKIVIPAIATGKGDDPLGRQPGEEMVSVRGREPGYFLNRRATMSAYVVSGMYQQEPVAAEGNFFRRAAFRYWRAVPGQPSLAWSLAQPVPAGAFIDLEGQRTDLADPAVWRFATIDVAASVRTSADWTVVAVWAIDQAGNLILLDRQRGRAEMADHFAMVRPLRERWRFDVLYVPREYWTSTLVIDARAAGVPVAEVVTEGDKVTRAIPAAGRVHAGKAWFPAVTSGCECGDCDGAWLDEFCDEMAGFPSGAAHDDQVDTLSSAARVAAAHWTPAGPPPRQEPLPRGLDQVERAYSAATGNGHGGPPDLMTMPLGLGDVLPTALLVGHLPDTELAHAVLGGERSLCLTSCPPRSDHRGGIVVQLRPAVPLAPRHGPVPLLVRTAVPRRRAVVQILRPPVDLPAAGGSHL